jgi:hypothetical protein
MADLMTGENSFAKNWVTRYRQAQQLRMPLEADWRRIAELGLPRHYGGWTSSNQPVGFAGSGQARAARVNTYDATLGIAFNIYSAVLERIMTPGQQMWHGLQAEDERLQKSQTIRGGLDLLCRELFRRRYEPKARFQQAQGELYVSHGAYGNAIKMITWREPRPQMRERGGLLYRTIPFRNMYWEVDDEEQIRVKFRRIDWTARQAYLALGDACPKKLKEIAEGPQTLNQNRTYEFVQCVAPNEDFDEHALDYRGLPIGSYYIYVEEPCLVKLPGGYRSDPFNVARSETEGGQPYGYGPAQVVMSTSNVVNAQAKTMLRQGQLAVQPPLLVRDDGVMNTELTPGAQIPGGVDSQGRRMVYPLEQGNFQIAEKLIEKNQMDIRAVLFGRIYEILQDQPQLTATQAIDLATREAAQLAPTMGRLQADDLGPQVEREIDLLAANGALPEGLPSELTDLSYLPVYTSPMAKMQKAEGTAGFFRLADMLINVAKMTDDGRAVRRLNFDKATPEIADQLSVPATWIKTDEEMAASDAEAAEQQKVATAVEALPAAASIAKTMADNNMKEPAA